VEYQKRINSKEEEMEAFTEHHAQDNLQIVQMETRLHELERQKFETRAEIMSVKKERRNSWSATKNISLRNPMRGMENTPIRMSFGSSSEEESVGTKSSRRNLIMHNDVESFSKSEYFERKKREIRSNNTNKIRNENMGTP
jgi:predicted RNA-binding protein with PUA-like domain